MELSFQGGDARIAVGLTNDAEEAPFVYDLVQSGRLQLEHPDRLPLPSAARSCSS